MGQLFRRYWLPCVASTELTPGTARAKLRDIVALPGYRYWKVSVLLTHAQRRWAFRQSLALRREPAKKAA